MSRCRRNRSECIEGMRVRQGRGRTAGPLKRHPRNDRCLAAHPSDPPGSYSSPQCRQVAPSNRTGLVPPTVTRPPDANASASSALTRCTARITHSCRGTAVIFRYVFHLTTPLRRPALVEEQGDSKLGLNAQRAAIEAEAARRSWDLLGIFTDTASGKSLSSRPGLEDALTRLDDGEAAVLIVSNLDRLSRSTKDFATLMERAQRRGWAPVVLDLGVDTTTPAGELVASVMVSVAQWERRINGQRTKEALAAKEGAGRGTRATTTASGGSS